MLETAQGLLSSPLIYIASQLLELEGFLGALKCIHRHSWGFNPKAPVASLNVIA